MSSDAQTPRHLPKPKAVPHEPIALERDQGYNDPIKMFDRSNAQTRVTVIAIDGPGASGKTVVGLSLARRLGYRFVDTGAIYRAVTRLVLEQGIPLDEDEALTRLASTISIRIGDESTPRLYVDSRDLSDRIYGPEVDRAISQVARVPGVREALLGLQHSMADEGRVVMAGRDIGTVVLPDADLKLFLLASAAERARRRYEELKGRGEPVDYGTVLGELERRDRLDTERAISPLAPARDAHQIQTDDRTIEEVVNAIWELTAGPCRPSTSL